LGDSRAGKLPVAAIILGGAGTSKGPRRSFADQGATVPWPDLPRDPHPRTRPTQAFASASPSGDVNYSEIGAYPTGLNGSHPHQSQLS
jgi:hypothetical protein